MSRVLTEGERGQEQDDSSQAEGGQEGEGLHGDVLDIDDLMELSQDALNTSRESVDPSFNLESSVMTLHIKTFVKFAVVRLQL